MASHVYEGRSPSQQLISRIALGDIAHRSALRFRNKTAIIDGDREVSYEEFDRRSSQFAHYLLSLGLQRGDKVGMLCNNSADMVIAFFGVYKAGLVWVPINTMLNVQAMNYIFEHAEIKLLVIDQVLALRSDIAQSLPDYDFPKVRVVYPGGDTNGVQLEFNQLIQSYATHLPELTIGSDDLTQIMYTSGTTGNQKGVMHSHSSIYSAITSNAIELSAGIGLDRTLCILPLFHCAQHSGTMASLLQGNVTVMVRGFDPVQVLTLVAKHRITQMGGLPMMYRAMIEHPRFSEFDLSSLRLCTYGMAPIPKGLLLRLLEEFCPTFMLGSGQTEMYPITNFFESAYQGKKIGAYWGIASVVNQMAIMNEQGQLLPPGEVGEIVFRGPNVMLGYFKDPVATAHAQRYDWHHTGDLGLIDEDGHLLFLDRMKDMIKSGGENVPSVKVEEVLLRHPAVANAAVVGLPHNKWSEAVTGFVLLKPDAQATHDEIMQHCRDTLGGFEVPKAIVFLDSLPSTSTGKIQKFEIRKRFIDYYEAQS